LLLWNSLLSLFFFSSSSSCCLTNICILHNAMNILTSLARSIRLQTNIFAWTKTDEKKKQNSQHKTANWQWKEEKNFSVYQQLWVFLYTLHSHIILRYIALIHSFSTSKHVLCLLSSGIARKGVKI
jgi:hypothetical protein